MNVFFRLSVEEAKILSTGLSDNILYIRFFIFSTVEGLCLMLNQENPYIMLNWQQLVNHGIYQKSVYTI